MYNQLQLNLFNEEAPTFQIEYTQQSNKFGDLSFNYYQTQVYSPDDQNDNVMTRSPTNSEPMSSHSSQNSCENYFKNNDNYSNVPSQKSTYGLRGLDEIPTKYRSVFSEYPSFNALQSKVFDDILYSEKPIVISAPTGSGKTVLFELAIISLLQKIEHLHHQKNFIVIYMAPIKALCAERWKDWNAKFYPLGLKCQEVTGDSDSILMSDLSACNIILTTPEKWDSLTRAWKDNKSLVETVKLFLLDEVHLLNDDHRGPVLEAVVSRMKTIQEVLSVRSSSNDINMYLPIRFMAVSATIPNINDVACWLGSVDNPAMHFSLGEEFRPVKLKKIVLGYNCPPEFSQFRFDMHLSYKMRPLLFQYAEGKPALIFCSTRKGVLQTADVLIQQVTFHFSDEQKEILSAAIQKIKETKIKKYVAAGVGCHHAGMDLNDRQITEQLFRNSSLPLLITTSTLAMGVNLPAHLVIIKSTQQYCASGYQEYSSNQILQMIGRSGRPQYDTNATAIIMTQISKVNKYTKLVEGTDVLESNLHQHLVEHLNSEVVLSTITEKAVAINWIRSTFLYVRALQNPAHYGISANLSKKGIEDKLQEMGMIAMNALASINLVKMDIMDVRSTQIGRLMAQHYMTFETMKTFTKIEGTETLPDMLNILSQCNEFSGCKLRVNEKRLLNVLNKSIRFPIKGLIKTLPAKISCLIQSMLGGLAIQEPSLQQESLQIARIGIRVTKCLTRYLALQDNHQSLLNAILLEKCFRCNLWENSIYVCRQLEGIGAVLSHLLVSAGKKSFQAIAESNPRDLERIINRAPPMGNRLKNAAQHMPKYSLQIDGSKKETSNELTVTVKVDNFEIIKQFSTPGLDHPLVLIIGDSSNKILFYNKFKDSLLVNNGGLYSWSRNIPQDTEIFINLLSEDWVGMDVQIKVLSSKTGIIIPSNTVPCIKDSPNKTESAEGKSKTKKQKEKQSKTPSSIRHLQSASSHFMKEMTKKKLRTNLPSKSVQIHLDKYFHIPKKVKSISTLHKTQETPNSKVNDNKSLDESKIESNRVQISEVCKISEHPLLSDKDTEKDCIESLQNIFQQHHHSPPHMEAYSNDKQEKEHMIISQDCFDTLQEKDIHKQHTKEQVNHSSLPNYTGILSITASDAHKHNIQISEKHEIQNSKSCNTDSVKELHTVPSKYRPIFFKYNKEKKYTATKDVTTNKVQEYNSEVSQREQKQSGEKALTMPVITFDLGIESLLSQSPTKLPDTPQIIAQPFKKSTVLKRKIPDNADPVSKLLYGERKVGPPKSNIYNTRLTDHSPVKVRHPPTNNLWQGIDSKTQDINHTSITDYGMIVKNNFPRINNIFHGSECTLDAITYLHNLETSQYENSVLAQEPLCYSANTSPYCETIQQIPTHSLIQSSNQNKPLLNDLIDFSPFASARTYEGIYSSQTIFPNFEE